MNTPTDEARPDTEQTEAITLPGLKTDNERIFLSEDGDTATIMLKRPVSGEKFKAIRLMENEKLDDKKRLHRVDMRVPRVSDRLAVSKMPGTIGNPVAFEFNMIARTTGLPTEVLETIATGDWENIQEALGKLTD